MKLRISLWYIVIILIAFVCVDVPVKASYCGSGSGNCNSDDCFDLRDSSGDPFLDHYKSTRLKKELFDDITKSKANDDGMGKMTYKINPDNNSVLLAYSGGPIFRSNEDWEQIYKGIMKRIKEDGTCLGPNAEKSYKMTTHEIS